MVSGSFGSLLFYPLAGSLCLASPNCNFCSNFSLNKVLS